MAINALTEVGDDAKHSDHWNIAGDSRTRKDLQVRFCTPLRDSLPIVLELQAGFVWVDTIRTVDDCDSNEMGTR